MRMQEPTIVFDFVNKRVSKVDHQVDGVSAQNTEVPDTSEVHLATGLTPEPA